MYVYLCQDTPESIFTGIYNIYQDRHNLPDTRILLEQEAMLFAEYITVTADAQKAAKVIRTIHRQFGERDAHFIFMALSAPSPDKAEAVYRTIAYGLEHHVGQGHLFDHLANRNVLLTHKLGLRASREAQHLKGFTRFRELENGILFAEIDPKNDILPDLMEHFSDRFPMENLMLLDEGRQTFGIHRSGEGWFLAAGEGVAERVKEAAVTEGELVYSALFRRFCTSIAIKERENPELQRNFLPMRFRPYMTEFMHEL